MTLALSSGKKRYYIPPMNFELRILEPRGPKVPLQNAAAIVPEGTPPMEGFALLRVIKLPEHVGKQVEPFFVGGTVQLT